MNTPATRFAYATRLNGFCLVDELRPFRSPWHAHRKVQLLAATSGTLRLEADGGQWVVSPQRAALLDSGVEHRAGSCAGWVARTRAKAMLPQQQLQCKSW